MKLTLSIIFAMLFPAVAAAVTLQGQLLKSDGKPLAYTELELVPLRSENIVIDQRLNSISNVSGKFSFIDVPPGKYTLSVNFDEKPTVTSPYTTFFYPAASKRDHAFVFEIDAASKLTPIKFQLPPALPTRTIVGKAVFPDGKPAVGARIGLSDIESGDSSTGYQDKVDRNGNFSIKGFVGRKYKVGGAIFDVPDLAFGELVMPLLAEGESEVFTLDANTPFITIRMRPTTQNNRIKDKSLGINFLQYRKSLRKYREDVRILVQL